ncbi:MAG: TldD/PmbA family protein [archaeon]|nr:TldD/PmbA family protein [archaeon]
MNGKDIADFAVDFGTSNGASYVEARLVSVKDETYSARNGMFLAILGSETKGIGIRVLADGGMGFASSEQLDKDSIRDLVNVTIKMAKASKRKDPIVFSEEDVVETNWKTPVKTKFVDVSIDEKKSYLKNLDKRLKSEAGKKLSSRISIMMLYSDEKYIANSDGSKISSENSLTTLMTMNSAKGRIGSEQRMFSMGGSGGWEWLKEQKIIDQCVKDNIALVHAAQTAKNIKFNKPIDVVVGSEVIGIMCHENVGHPSEGDRILGREGAQAGESFYVDLWEGDFEPGKAKIGNECITIMEDPTLPKSSGFYLYDDECVKARSRALIKNGMLNELLLNREFGAKFNTKSNGSARALAFNREPISRMANTYMAPGDYNTADELIEDIKEGILMNSFTEWNIDDRRFQSKYVGLEVHVIRNGELTGEMVRRPILELTTFGIFGSADAVTKEYSAPAGLCGKSDPMQGVPVDMGGGHVRLRKITVGGGDE